MPEQRDDRRRQDRCQGNSAVYTLTTVSIVFSDIPLKLPIDMQNRMSETAFTRSSKGSCLQDTLRLNRRIAISYVSYDCSLQLTDIPFNMKYRSSILNIHPP